MVAIPVSGGAQPMADSELLSAVRNMLHILCTKEPLKLITPGRRWGEKLPSLPAPTVWWPNSHRQTELVYLHRGACAMVLDDCAYKVDEGTICIIPAVVSITKRRCRQTSVIRPFGSSILRRILVGISPNTTAR